MLSRNLILFLCVSSFSPSIVYAEPIFLDFGADWETRLDELATSAGVDPFSMAERTGLQNNIQSRLETIYSAYTGVSFSQTSPSGSFTTVDFGATAAPGLLGVAGLDYGNLNTTQTVDVYTANFGFIVDEFSGSAARATQLDQLGAALAGTAGHEAAHAFGVLHHQSYGTDGIDPSTYANTGGLQNQHLIATGSTGLGEVGRETDRTLSEFSNLILEAAGGFNSAIFGPQSPEQRLAATVLQQVDNFSGGDVGDTPGTAFNTVLQNMAISGLRAFANASVLSSGADVDVFAFTALAPFQLFAQIYSEFRFTDDFDSRLRLLDSDGATVLAENTDVFYSGNTFDGGTFRTNDSSLVGILVNDPGTYYLEVSSVGNGSGSGDADGTYSLIFGIDEADSAVPEPNSFVLGLLMIVGIVALRRRFLSLDA